MGKPHPLALRSRVVIHVEEGHTHRLTASHFRVSIKFVNDMVKLKRETGCLVPNRQGKPPGRGKLTPYRDWIAQRIAEKSDLTLNELRVELFEQFGVKIHTTTIGRFLHKLGLSHKKRRFTPANNAVQM